MGAIHLNEVAVIEKLMKKKTIISEPPATEILKYINEQNAFLVKTFNI